MRLIPINIECDQCHKVNKDTTRYVPDYNGTVLKSFWCEFCEAPQAVRFKFVDEKTEITERIDPTTIYVQRKPDTGLTVRPRAGKRSG